MTLTTYTNDKNQWVYIAKDKEENDDDWIIPTNKEVKKAKWYTKKMYFVNIYNQGIWAYKICQIFWKLYILYITNSRFRLLFRLFWFLSCLIPYKKYKFYSCNYY